MNKELYKGRNTSNLNSNEKRIRLLAYSDSVSCATGFGQVAKNILMSAHGSGKFNIVQLGINYWGDPHGYPIDIFPMGINRENDPYGRKKFMDLALALDYDILFCQQDTFILMLLKNLVPQLRSKGKNQNIIVYFPVDGIPKKEWIEGISYADYLIAYSKWGKDMAIKSYPPIADKIVDVIPLGINFNNFHPVSETDIKEFRRGAFKHLADNFIFTIVARNQQRKDLTRALIAFKEVKKKRPDTILYMHMAMNDLGWRLGECCKSLGLDTTRDVIFPNNFNINTGFPINIVNLIYNSSDCVISTALGEGHGLSQTEAMATKTPVIVPDNTVHPEVCGYGERGILVKSGGDPDHMVIIPNDYEVLRPAVHVHDLVEKMVWMVDNRNTEQVEGMVEKAYKWVVSELDWDKLMPRFFKIFDDALKAKAESSNIVADLL
jgi:glycosyltransferase involved in cell wall biosynthesis